MQYYTAQLKEPQRYRGYTFYAFHGNVPAEELVEAGLQSGFVYYYPDTDTTGIHALRNAGDFIRRSEATLVYEGKVISMEDYRSFLCSECSDQLACCMGKQSYCRIKDRRATPQGTNWDKKKAIGKWQYVSFTKLLQITGFQVTRYDVSDVDWKNLKTALDKDSPGAMKGVTTKEYKKTLCPKCHWHNDNKYSKKGCYVSDYRYCWSSYRSEKQDKPEHFTTPEDYYRALDEVIARYDKQEIETWYTWMGTGFKKGRSEAYVGWPITPFKGKFTAGYVHNHQSSCRGTTWEISVEELRKLFPEQELVTFTQEQKRLAYEVFKAYVDKTNVVYASYQGYGTEFNIYEPYLKNVCCKNRVTKDNQIASLLTYDN